MRYNIVNSVAYAPKICFSFLELCFARYFCGPPTNSFLTAFLVHAFGAAESKERISFDIEDLTTHEMDDIVADAMHLAAMPLCNGQTVENIKVLVVTVYEEECYIKLT